MKFIITKIDGGDEPWSRIFIRGYIDHPADHYGLNQEDANAAYNEAVYLCENIHLGSANLSQRKDVKEF